MVPIMGTGVVTRGSKRWQTAMTTNFGSSLSRRALGSALGDGGVWCCLGRPGSLEGTGGFKGSMPPSIGHMELLAWMQRADFSEHIQGCKSPGDPLNSSHFDAPNTKSAPTGYRRAPNIISHHYKQQLSAKASIVPKARPIRFR